MTNVLKCILDLKICIYSPVAKAILRRTRREDNYVRKTIKDDDRKRSGLFHSTHPKKHSLQQTQARFERGIFGMNTSQTHFATFVLNIPGREVHLRGTLNSGNNLPTRLTRKRLDTSINKRIKCNYPGRTAEPKYLEILIVKCAGHELNLTYK